MIIIERSLSQEALDEDYGRDSYAIIVDGKQRVSANDYGEPEDNSLGRDLNFVYNIVGLMKEAYEAGKRGETFEVLQEKVDSL